jgi:hypothetical protein
MPPGPPTAARSKAAHGPPATLLTAQASDPSALSNALHSLQLHGTPLDSQRTFRSEGELTVALLQAVAEHAGLASTASSSAKENEVPLLYMFIFIYIYNYIFRYMSSQVKACSQVEASGLQCQTFLK